MLSPSATIMLYFGRDSKVLYIIHVMYSVIKTRFPLVIHYA